MLNNTQTESRPDRIVRRALVAFLIVFPLAGGVRMFTGLPPASINLVLLIAFALFLSMLELIIWVREHEAANPRRKLGFAHWMLIIFCILSSLSTLHSVNSRLSLLGIPGEYGGFLPLTCNVVLFFVIVRRVKSIYRIQMVRAMAIGSILPTVYAILQHVPNVPDVTHVNRSTSFFWNADFSGTYMALVLILTIGLYVLEPATRSLPCLALICGQFVALVYTSTRSAWLGAAMAAVMFGVLAMRRNPSLWRRLGLLLGMFAVCWVVINRQSHNQVATRAVSIATNAQQIVTNHNSNFAGSSRWYIWKESIPIIEHHPFLGTGPDTFEFVFQPPKGGQILYLNGQPIANANNAYIQKGVTLGIPALLAMLAFYGSVLLKGWDSMRSRDNESDRLMVAMLFSCMIGYLIQAFFNMDVVGVVPLFWVIAALAFRRRGVR